MDYYGSTNDVMITLKLNQWIRNIQMSDHEIVRINSPKVPNFSLINTSSFGRGNPISRIIVATSAGTAIREIISLMNVEPMITRTQPMNDCFNLYFGASFRLL